MSLTQQEADALLALTKRFVQQTPIIIGRPESYKLVAVDGREEFHLDTWRGRINLHKYTYHHRGRQVYTLARLDVGGAPHRNPDGQRIEPPHIHLYREGFGDKWAFPLSQVGLTLADPHNLLQAFIEFTRFCHIDLNPDQIVKVNHVR